MFLYENKMIILCVELIGLRSRFDKFRFIQKANHQRGSINSFYLIFVVDVKLHILELV